MNRWCRPYLHWRQERVGSDQWSYGHIDLGYDFTNRLQVGYDYFAISTSSSIKADRDIATPIEVFQQLTK